MKKRSENSSRRMERTRRPAKCPSCGVSPVGTILYGMPAYDEEMHKEVEEGLTIIGGCCVSNDDPVWQCSKCKQQIYRKRK